MNDNKNKQKKRQEERSKNEYCYHNNNNNIIFYNGVISCNFSSPTLITCVNESNKNKII